MKHYKLLTKFFFLTFFGLFSSIVNSAENNSAFIVYSGMFDFSDAGAKSTLVGFQHQNEDLNKDIFLGNISPITGGFITGDMASYVYTGVVAQYQLGIINFSPSFAPGLYYKGDGKDLHSVIEFKTELQWSLPLTNDGEVGFSYNHMSNAGIGKSNPGANSYMFNFQKKF